MPLLWLRSDLHGNDHILAQSLYCRWLSVGECGSGGRAHQVPVNIEAAFPVLQGRCAWQSERVGCMSAQELSTAHLE